MNKKPIPSQVVHRPTLCRFESELDGELAILEYSIQGNLVHFDHTEVPLAFRGKGIGNILVRAALTEARQQRWRVVPNCSFVATFLRRHPEFSDVTA